MTGDIPLEYRGGSGPALVLLHGVNTSWRNWEAVIPLLRERHELFVPTMAGHNGAEPVSEDGAFTMADFVDSVARQLDRAGVGPAHLAGNSLGGLVALELARRGRARSVVAFSPVGGWGRPRDLDRLVRLFRLSGRVMATGAGRRLMASRSRATLPVRNLSLRYVAGSPARITEGQRAIMLEDMAACTAIAGLLDSVSFADRVGPMRPAPCPIRIAWGEKDRTLPFRHYGKALLEAIPEAELVRLPGAGHVPMHDDPELVARTILEVTTAPAASGSTSSTVDDKLAEG